MTPSNDSPEGAPDPLADRLLKALQQDARLLDELERKIRAAHDGTPAGSERPEPPCDSPVGQTGSRPDEAPAPDPLRTVGVGSKLGEYRLLERVGSGGMGTVHKAVHTASSLTNVYHAIKVLKPETRIPRADEKFRDETERLARLGHHDHIVPLYHAHIDTKTGVHFLVMPPVTGSSLAEYLATKNGQPPDWRWVADVIRQVANGLVAIDRALPGLVHRDLKPANILLEPLRESDTRPAGIRVLVADFGLAIIPRASPGTNSPTRLGTVSYFSPEYITHSNSVTQRSDIFSLGVIAYELLTNPHPFQTDPYDPAKVMFGILRHTPDGIHTSRPNVPGAFVDRIGRMMSKSPLDRPLQSTSSKIWLIS